jgi:UDP-hydrolysing UDP-N-acetyl-D-glucosamine 2-epimerase
MKKIAVFTTIRSEYGLLSPLLEKLRVHRGCELCLLVGGAHLLFEYGHTMDQIKKDGFEIAQTFPFLYTDTEADCNIRSLASLTQQAGVYFTSQPPDLLFVLGDRFELMPVVMAALMCNVPVAHLSGGETTEGAVDNQIRHAITKMAHLHFPATEQYAENIRKMGEEPWRICVSGETGIDRMIRMKPTPKEDLYKDLGLDVDKQTLLVTFHPETLTGAITPKLIEQLFHALLEQYSDVQILVTAANFDDGGQEFNATYERLAAVDGRIIYIKSLGQQRYYSTLHHAAAMVGNSSSGLVEAQTFSLPVVNVGTRQKGRLSNKNVVHVPANIDSIIGGLRLAMSRPFRDSFTSEPNIYGNGGACDKILQFIDSVPWNKLLIKRNAF